MPRKPTEDLESVKLAPAARRPNTFVQGRRASKTNTALQLADSLGKGSQIALDIGEKQRKKNNEQVEMDIQTATDNKLAGGNLFNDTYRENIADYEKIKGTLKTPEEAAKYFVKRNAKQFPDRHNQAGYDKKMRDKLTDFIAKHNQFVVGEKIKNRNVNLTKAFYNDVIDGNTETAFSDLVQAAKNYGASPAQTNTLVMEAVKAMLAQGRVDKAEEVLKFNRGAAKSLLENPETAVDAAILMKRVVDTRKAIEEARLEDAKVENRIAEEVKIQNENDFYDNVLNNPKLTNAQKTLALENAMGNFEINKDFRDVMKRTLTAREEAANPVNNEIYASLLQKAHNLAAVADSLHGTDEEFEYMRGLRNLRLEAMQHDQAGDLGKDGQKLLNQINSLSDSKEAAALAEIGKTFTEDATNFINASVAPQNRGDVIKRVFFATEDIRAKQKEAALNKKDYDTKGEYLKRTEEVISKFKEEQVLKAKKRVEDTKDSSPINQYLQDEGKTLNDVRNELKVKYPNKEWSDDQVRAVIHNKISGQQGAKEDKGSAGSDGILDLIGTIESKGDYNIAFGDRKVNFTSMTIDEVLKWQEANNPPGKGTAAAGKYQIIHKTLKGLVNSHGIDKDALFDEAMQDKLGGMLLEARKRKATVNGKLDKEKYAIEMAKEWASFPVPKSMQGHNRWIQKGESYYAGDSVNKSLVPLSKVEEVLASL